MLLLCYQGTAFAQLVTFSSSSNYSATSYPNAIAVTDFNGDGRQDIAILGSNLSVFLNAGNGNFTLTSTLVPGSLPTSMVTGDFNGDGKQDIAVTDLIGHNVVIYLGNGDGTFRAPTTYPANGSAYGIAAGDFNGDGNLDLVVTNAYGGMAGQTLQVLLGNGDGTFRNPVPYATGSNAVAVITGDFNGDGKLDLVAANSGSNSVSLLLGNGDGTFRTATSIAVGARPWALVAADFDGDGKLDLAVANNNSNNVSILLGRGDGTFLAPNNLAAGTVPISVAVADLNDDGQPDLVVANQFSNNLSVFVSKGDGTFQAPVNIDLITTPVPIATIDIDGDGRSDIVVGNRTTSSISVFANKSASSTAIAAQSGNDQSAPLNSAYSVTLKAVVKDANNNPLQGRVVTFTAPASGASGTFSGGARTVKVATDASGTAMTPIFSANGTPGPFSVIGRVASRTASFSLNNVSGSGSSTQAPIFTSGAPPVGVFNVPYSFTVTATGVPSPTFSTVANTLPPGLTLGTTTGVVSGTPSVGGIFSGMITATNGITPNATQIYTTTINPGSQTISFPALSDQILGTVPFPIVVTASSGLTVALSSLTPSVCTLNANVVSMEAIGVCTIRATQGGNANYSAAQNVDRSFAVAAASAPMTAWVDDAIPLGATIEGTNEGWTWIGGNPAPYAGILTHTSDALNGVHQHYFYGATDTLFVAPSDVLFTYVYLDPAAPPSEVMLQWNDGSWEHRAYWGANNIGWGVDGSASRRYMGPLPPIGRWVQLQVPAAMVGLEGRTLNGMAFTLYDGRAVWDFAGKAGSAQAANQPPLIAFSYPTNNASYAGPAAAIGMDVSTRDPDGTISKVEMYGDGALLTTLTAPPYTYTWRNVPGGTHVVSAKATDNKGASAVTAPITVTVIAPSVEITAPNPEATFAAGATINLSANATAYGGTLTNVAFYHDGISIGSSSLPPYTVAWSNASPGTYVITARAFENYVSSGTTYFTYETSAPITIKVIAVANQPPTITLTAPTDNSTYTAPAAISPAASVADSDGSVTKVEFFAESSGIPTLFGASNTAPFNWRWTNVPAGSYTVTAKATDNKGATTLSSPIHVTVLAQAPAALTAVAVSGSRIDLAWTDTLDSETGFKVERRLSTTGSYVEVATTAPNTTSYTDTALTPLTEYYYRIRASTPTADSGYSNEARATTLSGSSPVSVNITSPIANSSLNGERVEVSGTYLGPSNTGVTVNGVLASTVGDAFYASDVVVEVGGNTITATVTAPDGSAALHTINVTSTALAYFNVSAHPASGVAPFIATFTITEKTLGSLAKADVDFDGDGTSDFTSRDSNTPINFTYTRPGIYRPRFALTDSTGNVYAQTLLIVVKDPATTDQIFRGIWTRMNDALVAGDKTAAMQYLNIQAQGKYGAVFDALLPDMPRIVGSYTAFVPLDLSDTLTEYVVSRTVDGANRIFIINFVQDDDGVWRIDSM